MTAADTLLERLDGVRSVGPDKYIARCPAHEDRKPSLSIKRVDDRALIYCWAGCSALDVVAALGLELGDLFDRRPEICHGPARPALPSARELLVLLEYDLAVVECVFSDVMVGLPFSEDDRRTAADSMHSIRRILDVCHAAG